MGNSEKPNRNKTFYKRKLVRNLVGKILTPTETVTAKRFSLTRGTKERSRRRKFIKWSSLKKVFIIRVSIDLRRMREKKVILKILKWKRLKRNC